MSGLSWFAPAPAMRLAVLRFLVGGFSLVYLLARLPALVGVTRYPDSQFRPVGPVHLLDNPLPEAVVYLLVAASVALAVAFFVGWKYRYTGPAFALVLLWVLSYRNSWGMIFHTENLTVLHAFVLGFTPAADALSVDARGKPAPADSPRYGWPTRLMCGATVLAYFIAGYAKVQASGFNWAFDDTLLVQVAYDNARKVELGDFYSPLGGFMVRYGWLFPPLAFVSLIVELIAPLALFNRRFAVLWSVLAWGFHLGVLAMMYILFPYPLLGFAYAPFFPVEKLPDFVRRRFRRSK